MASVEVVYSGQIEGEVSIPALGLVVENGVPFTVDSATAEVLCLQDCYSVVVQKKAATAPPAEGK